MSGNKNKSFNLRKDHNSELIRRMRNGEPLNSIDSKNSWYPPRPIIKKDEAEMARVYGAPVAEKSLEPGVKAVDEGDGAAVTHFRAS
jgi:hypothetical protein